ncbi:MAG: FAD-dependent thymidylate synthase [Oscillospiraceae bacterium]|jgi:thymidylate synthase (FAD)
MKVTLIAHTPDPDKTVAAAAKLCYSNSDAVTLMDGLTEEKAQKFLGILGDMGHQSPIEHASFTFGIEGVSRSLLAQITRHRIASYSVQSQRYVRMDNFSYVTPHTIENDPEALEIFKESMERAREDYEKLAGILKKNKVKELVASGMPQDKAEKKAEKMVLEDARFVLPNACETRLVMTMNARSLLNFFRLRCCNRAQWEIRELAEQMYRLVLDVAPGIFAKAGPACLYGPCPEGSKCCGKAEEVREKYKKIREESEACRKET